MTITSQSDFSKTFMRNPKHNVYLQFNGSQTQKSFIKFSFKYRPHKT